MRAKLDTFDGSVIAIFIILALLLIASVYFPYYPPGSIPESERVIHKFTAGTVGFSQDSVSRTVDFGSFGVGLPQQEPLKTAPKMEITASLFGSTSEKFTVSVPQNVLEFIKGGQVSFDVADTNRYGNLIVRWNGAEVYAQKAENGKHAVTLDASQIKAENTAEFLAQGPGLLFWASTVYSLRDIRVSADYGPAKFLDFEVSQDELESLARFELGWFTASRKGNLVIKVNGEQMFSRLPERQDKLEFGVADLKEAAINPGVNRFTLIAQNGSFELQGVTLRTFVSKNQRVIKERFDVSEAQMKLLRAKGGVINAYVKAVGKAGELRAKLNEETAGSVQAKAGQNNIGFSAGQVHSGANWLEVSGTGTFDVGEVSVELA